MRCHAALEQLTLYSQIKITDVCVAMPGTFVLHASSKVGLHLVLFLALCIFLVDWFHFVYVCNSFIGSPFGGGRQ